MSEDEAEAEAIAEAGASPPLHMAVWQPIAAAVATVEPHPSPSPSWGNPRVPAVACCDVVTDREGNPAFRCRFPGCEKTYASRDAVRRHCRINHLQWLRSCGFVPSAVGPGPTWG